MSISALLTILLINLHQTNIPKTLVSPIIDGSSCSTKMYPYFVSIKENTSNINICGGTLLNSQWVLTAAHCFEQKLVYVVVIFHSSIDDKIFVNIKDVLVHPKFNAGLFLNDIALVKLEKTLNVSRSFNFTRLPKKSHQLQCKKLTIMGLGSLSAENIILPRDLQCGTVKMISTKLCSIFYRRFLKSSLCTLSYKSDTCQGDSGGPLLCDETQVGIVSYGVSCGKNSPPGVYTKIDDFLDFIKITSKATTLFHNKIMAISLFISKFALN